MPTIFKKWYFFLPLIGFLLFIYSLYRQLTTANPSQIQSVTLILTLLGIFGTIVVPIIIHFREQKFKTKTEHKKQINERVIKYLLIKVNDWLKILERDTHNIYCDSENFISKKEPDYVDAHNPEQIKLLGNWRPLFDYQLYNVAKKGHIPEFFKNFEGLDEKIKNYNFDCLEYVQNLHNKVTPTFQERTNLLNTKIYLYSLTIYIYKKKMDFKTSGNFYTYTPTITITRLIDDNHWCADGPEMEIKVVINLTEQLILEKDIERDKLLGSSNALLTEVRQIKDKLADIELKSVLPGECEYCK